jgi:hypothetical protein
MTIKGFLVGFVAGLIFATFAPSVAGFARNGFDVTRDLSGRVIQGTGTVVRP